MILTSSSPSGPSLILEGDDFYGNGYLVTEPFLQIVDKKTVRQEYLSTFFEGIPAPPLAPGLPIFISKNALESKVLPFMKDKKVEASINVPATHTRYRVFVNVGNKVIDTPFILQDNILDIERSSENTDERSVFELKDLVVTTKTQSTPVPLSSVLINDQAKLISAVTWGALHQMVKDYGEMIAIRSADGDVLVAKNENLSKKGFLVKAVAGLVMYKTLKRFLL